MIVEDYKKSRPARSALFCLAPIGLGSAQAESLESYTCRLACRHGIPRHKLEQLINHQGEPLYNDSSGPPRLDSPTEIAAGFSQRLAQATGQPMVAALGLGRFAGRLAVMSTLRKHRAWCGMCFRDARDGGIPANLPLLWSLQSYQRCIVHGNAMETQCRACARRSFLSNSWHQALDHCPWCDEDLAAVPSDGFAHLAHLERRGQENVDLFLGRILGDFVARASSSTAPVGPADITRVVTSAIDRGVATCSGDLIKKVGLAAPTLSTMKSGRNRPSLAALLRLAAGADVSLMGVFDPAHWCEGVAGAPPPHARHLPRLQRHRGRYDWERISCEVAAELDRGAAPTMAEIAKRLGTDHAYVAEKLRHLRGILKERGRAARKMERQKRLTELIETVRPIRETLARAGKKPSIRAIAAAMQRPGRAPYLVAAIRAVNEVG
jgi:TniQ